MTDTGEGNEGAPPADLDDEVDDDVVGATRRRRWLPIAAVAAIVVIGGIVAGLLLTGGSSSAAMGPEGVPLVKAPDLAPAATTASGKPIDGITCRDSMQQSVGNHIHVHVAIFVDGKQRRLPAGAGIAAPRSEQQLADGLFVDNGPTGCLYWLHVHSDDGIVHVESPTQQQFTLGDFFDIWQQPLGPDQVGPAKGTVVAFENGKRFDGNPRDIPLLPQGVIQLDVGTPVVPFRPMTFDVKNLCGAGSQGCALPPS